MQFPSGSHEKAKSQGFFTSNSCTPHTAVHVQVLSQLGVWILDADALGNQARNPMVLKYASACSPSGVLSALQQALFPESGRSGAEQQQQQQLDFGPGGAARRRVDNRFQSVPPAERDSLRRFLSSLQRTGAQLTDQQTELLKGLPIYRVHDGGAAAASERRGGAAGARFTSVSGAERLLLAPRGTDSALLGPTFAVEERGDTELLEGLGVKRVGKGVFFREHVLPREVETRVGAGVGVGVGRSLPLGEWSSRVRGLSVERSGRVIPEDDVGDGPLRFVSFRFVFFSFGLFRPAPV